MSHKSMSLGHKLPHPTGGERTRFENFKFPSSYYKDDIDRVFRRPVYKSLIYAPFLQRLKRISFLGAIDYALYSNRQIARTWRNRFHHSIAVAHLTLTYAQEAELSPCDEIELVVAALLHDVGHFPLSHSFEKTIKRRLGFGHHDSLIRLLHGGRSNAQSLPAILREHSVSTKSIEEIVSGEASNRFSWFNGSINFDTLEGITRCNRYLGFRGWALTSEVVHSLAYCKNDAVSFLDDFWTLKGAVYSQLIQSRIGRDADEMAMASIETIDDEALRQMLDKDDEWLFSLLPNLLEKLQNIVGSQHEALTGHYVKRTFEINRLASGTLPALADSRYVQKKENQ